MSEMDIDSGKVQKRFIRPLRSFVLDLHRVPGTRLFFPDLYGYASAVLFDGPCRSSDTVANGVQEIDMQMSVCACPPTGDGHHCLSCPFVLPPLLRPSIDTPW